MLDEDRLRGLAGIAPLRPARPLAEIQRRSGQLRRARRAAGLTAGAAALAAAALVAQVVVGAGPGGGGPVTSVLPYLQGAPANADGADCRGFADLVRREDVSPALRYLLPADALGRPLRQAWGRRIRLTCPETMPVAVLVDFSADHSTARRSLAIWGPAAVPSGEPRVELRVRGGVGQLVTRPETAGALSLGWTEPDGTRWVVTSGGVSRAQLLAAVNRLRLVGGQVVGTSLPRGYDQVQFPEPVDDAESFWWNVQYGDQPSQPGDDVGVQLTVHQPAGPPPETRTTLEAAGRVRFIDVNGARAAYTVGEGGVSSLEWQTAQGVGFLLGGPLKLAEMAALARRLQPVSAADPRLADVPDGR